MFELYLDQIDLKKSKAKNILTFKKHDWSDDLSFPALTLIFPITWITLTTYDGTIFDSNNLIINLVVFALLIAGLIFLYRNLIQVWKLESISSEQTISSNRSLVLEIATELGIESIKNNGNYYMGVYSNSFPFKQIVTIIYAKNKVLFNARNNCIGNNGRVSGRPPFGFGSSKKLFIKFQSKFENSESR